MTSKRTRKMSAAEVDAVLAVLKVIGAAEPLVPAHDAEFDACVDALLQTPLDLGLELDFDQLDTVVSAPPAVIAAPVAVESTCGTHKISLRLPRRTIAAFKVQAERTGTRYQTLIVRTLNAACMGWRK